MSDERGQQRRPRRRAAPSVWVAPAGLGRLDDRVDEQGERGGDRQRAGRVIPAPLDRAAAVAQQARRQHQRDHADGDIDEEDPLPADVGQRAADQPARGAADAAERAPDPERLVALGAFLEGRGDDRERRRGHDRGADALQRPRGDQRRRRPREPAQQRGEREQHQPGHEDAGRPSRSAARPPSRSSPPNVSAYALRTHCRSWVRSRGPARSTAARRPRSRRRG